MVELAFGKVVSEIVYGLTRVRDDKKLTVSELLKSVLEKEYSILKTEKVSKKSAISYFLIQLSHPVWFYFTYIHCANILKHTFHCSAEQIIHQNLIVSIGHLLMGMFLGYLSSFIYPLKILTTLFYIFIPFLLLTPFLFSIITSPFELMLIQLLIMTLSPSEFPASPIFYKSFPVFKRFAGSCFCYATARALMYLVTSFGIIYLIKYFGNWGLSFLFIPVIIAYGFALFHFVNLEKQKESAIYTQQSSEIA